MSGEFRGVDPERECRTRGVSGSRAVDGGLLQSRTKHLRRHLRLMHAAELAYLGLRVPGQAHLLSYYSSEGLASRELRLKLRTTWDGLES